MNNFKEMRKKAFQISFLYTFMETSANQVDLPCHPRFLNKKKNLQLIFVTMDKIYKN